MKIPPSYLRKAKNAAHAIQALTIFLGWCLTIAIFTQDGSTDGRTKYFFALVSTISYNSAAADMYTSGPKANSAVSPLLVLVQRPSPRLPDDRATVAASKEVREPIRLRGPRPCLRNSLVRGLHRGRDVERGGHRGGRGEEEGAGRWRLLDVRLRAGAEMPVESGDGGDGGGGMVGLTSQELLTLLLWGGGVLIGGWDVQCAFRIDERHLDPRRNVLSSDGHAPRCDAGHLGPVVDGSADERRVLVESS